MDIFVKFLRLQYILLFSDFIDFTHIAASNIANDDITN